MLLSLQEFDELPLIFTNVAVSEASDWKSHTVKPVLAGINLGCTIGALFLRMAH